MCGNGLPYRIFMYIRREAPGGHEGVRMGAHGRPYRRPRRPTRRVHSSKTNGTEPYACPCYDPTSPA
jgi:hypothetical protein